MSALSHSQPVSDRRRQAPDCATEPTGWSDYSVTGNRLLAKVMHSKQAYFPVVFSRPVHIYGQMRTGESSVRMTLGRRGRSGLWRALIPALAFFLMGATWALASPPGSAADDDYHLSSIWCAWGNSETCVVGPNADSVFVPESVALAGQCYNFEYEIGGVCTKTLTRSLVATDRFNTGSYPSLFYSVMRAFVGPDVERSVVMMRIANTALCSVILALALSVVHSGARQGIVVAWLTCLVPIAIFFIPSTNPSS